MSGSDLRIEPRDKPRGDTALDDGKEEQEAHEDGVAPADVSVLELALRAQQRASYSGVGMSLAGSGHDAGSEDKGNRAKAAAKQASHGQLASDLL